MRGQVKTFEPPRPDFEESKTELWVMCAEDQHTFVAAFLPMPMAKCAEILMGLRCPKCAGKNILLASRDVLARQPKLPPPSSDQ